MKTRTRRFALLAAGAGVALAPLGAATPAGAATTETDAQGSVTFVDYAGRSVTCNVESNTFRDTDQNNYLSFSVGSSGTDPECLVANFSMSIKYTDTSGAAQEARTLVVGNYQGNLSVTGAASKISTQVVAKYVTSCDRRASTTCGVSIISNPK